MVIPDTWLDARFVTHPFVVGAPFIRFYVDIPLSNPSGVAIGTLCLTDTEPHTFSAQQVATVNILAGLANHRRLIRDLQFLKQAEDEAARRLVIIECLDLARSLGVEPASNLLRDLATLLPLRLRLMPGNLFYVLSAGRFALLTSENSRLSTAWIAGKLEGITADIDEGLSVSLAPHSGETGLPPAIRSPARLSTRRCCCRASALPRQPPDLACCAASRLSRCHRRRGVQIVAAGVHFAGNGAAEGQPGLLLNRQRVHISAQQHGFT
ncbi:hypothetical protein EIO60_00074|nr:hypothetical protein [Candidatus Pantoea persica]